MGSNLQITIDEFAPTFTKLAKNVNIKKVFPNTLLALNMIAINHLVLWRKYAGGVPIPGVPKALSFRGDYAKSIMSDFSRDQLKVIFSKGKWTDEIEKGKPEFDLKPGLLHGKKARMGKKGLYNIIPFRHGTPNSLQSNNPMPPEVYKVMLQKTNQIDRMGGVGTSRIVGKGPGVWQRANGNTEMRLNYAWGFRLPSAMGGAAETKKTSQGDYTWSTGKRTGMVRMDASTKRARSSKYITFRVVSYKSDPASWIIPAKDPVPIRQKVVDTLRAESEKLIKMGMEEDLK